MPDWLEIVLRTLGLFVLILLIIPLLGRKPLTGMTFFDYLSGFVLAVMIALTALAIVDIFSYGLLAILLWILAILAVQYMIQKSKWAHDHIYGKEIVVIKNGKVLEENLHAARLTGEELLSQLRRKNIFQLADVEFAVMEANGDITALLKREQLPLTPKDIGQPVSRTKEVHTVILDGNIMDEGLAAHGLNRGWLMTELEKLGISAENVFIAQVDSMGELYIDTFDDAFMLPPANGKKLLLTTLKKIEADMMTYALETNDQEWKQNYGQFAQEMNQIVKELEPHLRT